jgi:hypothetical protein
MSKPMKIGLIGWLTVPHVEIAAACDINEQAVKKLAAEIKGHP